MYIDGAWIEAEGGNRFEVTNPATGEILDNIPDGGVVDAQKAIAAAHAAQPAWAATTAYARSDILRKAWQIMMARQTELARLMTTEQGKPLKAAATEVRYGADFLLWFSEEAKRIEGSVLPSARADQRFIVLRQPVGVVAAVTPWNYPMSMLTRKMGPALAAGCTVVLKPAEATPLCAKAIFEVFEEAGAPAGVINLVTALDPKPIGDVFTTDPRVRKLTFTGSTAVGKHLAGAAAANMQRVSMELGGHAPFIVYPDADPVHAAKGATAVKFLNTGQACISPNRMYVHADLYEPFLDTMVGRVERMRGGNGLEEGIAIGPLVNEAAVAKVERQVEDARAKGARVMCGGHRLMDNGLDRGHFYAPTVLADVTPDMTIYREETFGPVAPVIRYDDPETVLDLANDTGYGLAAYVYTNNIARGMRAFEGLHFGIVGINDINPTAAAAPFGGMKSSGLGREGGHEGIDEYLETKLGGFAV